MSTKGPGAAAILGLCFMIACRERYAAATGLARRLFRRAAAFLWIRPLRAARSSSCTAGVLTSVGARRDARLLERGAKRGALGAVANGGGAGLPHVLFRGGDIRHETLQMRREVMGAIGARKLAAHERGMSRRHTLHFDTRCTRDAPLPYAPTPAPSAHPGPPRRIGSKHADEHSPHHPGAALLAGRARVRARIRRPQAGRSHGVSARAADVQSDQAHRSVHDDASCPLSC